jgi:hypothetical protein
VKGEARFFSRLTLKRDSGAIGAIASLLREGVHDLGQAHRLIWTLFADAGGSKRDFLFRQMEGGRAGDFLVVSACEPRDPAGIGLWRVETKIYDPRLAVGDALAFRLRANPTVTRYDSEAKKVHRHDVVMDRKKQLGSNRSLSNPEIWESAGRGARRAARYFAHPTCVSRRQLPTSSLPSALRRGCHPIRLARSFRAPKGGGRGAAACSIVPRCGEVSGLGMWLAPR